jgi:hypothetical protein
MLKTVCNAQNTSRPFIHALNSTCVIITTRCTLNCKYCLNYQPYIKNKKHYDLAGIKRDVDLFFGVHDKVEYFAVSGGEPFLHPGLGELLQYIYDRHHDKLLHLGTATNCTVVPTDELCKVLRDCRVELLCDDYLKSDKFGDIVRQLRKFGVLFKQGNPRFFITYPPDPETLLESDLRKKFAACKRCYTGHGLKNGRLYACCYSMFAETAGLCAAMTSDYLDLENASQEELLEFRTDHSAKGYTTFCRYCNGFYPFNQRFDPNGVTQEGDTP